MKNRTLLGLLGAAALVASGYFVAIATAAGVPTNPAETLYYAGYLMDQGAPLQGQANISVDVYSGPGASGADLVCTTTVQTVDVEQGHFRVALPPACVSAFQDEPDTWIRLTVNGTPLPTARIGAVPYALEAAHATTADSANSANTATAAVTADTALAVDWTDVSNRLRIGSARVSSAGVMSENNAGVFTSCSKGAPGAYTCNYTGAFDGTPHCWVQITGASALFTRADPGPTSVSIQLYSTGAGEDASFYVFCMDPSSL